MIQQCMSMQNVKQITFPPSSCKNSLSLNRLIKIQQGQNHLHSTFHIANSSELLEIVPLISFSFIENALLTQFNCLQV